MTEKDKCQKGLKGRRWLKREKIKSKEKKGEDKGEKKGVTDTYV